MDYDIDFKHGFNIINTLIEDLKISNVRIKEDLKYSINKFASLYSHFHNSIKLSVLYSSSNNVEIYSLYSKCIDEDKFDYLNRINKESELIKETSKRTRITLHTKQNLEKIANSFKKEFNLFFQLSNATNNDILDFINKQSGYNKTINKEEKQ